MGDSAWLQCVRADCAATSDLSAPTYRCPACGSLLDVTYDWNRVGPPSAMNFFETRWPNRRQPLDHSGVWRFRELLPFLAAEDLMTLGEGQTLLHAADTAGLGLPIRPGRLFLQYEGLNPSGSFKDNGMAAAISMARSLGTTRVGCASTGNTSASMALYAANTPTRDGAPMRSIVFVGSGKIAVGKLAQALDHGALTLQIAGDFDACMNRMQEAADRLGLYLMNSINPFRLEGQKTIIYRVLESLAWEPPEWIVVPGGNLGNTSAFGKALHELRELGLIRRLPRLAVVNATGANTFAKLFNQQGLRWRDGDWDAAAAQAFDERIRREGRTARTVASAIEIARPVNLPKALRSLAWTDGVVCEVSDEEILNDRALLARHGLGCEPASAASLAGLRRLMADGTIGRDDRTVCILTGHALKDPSAVVGFHTGGRLDFVPAACEPTSRSANRPIPVADDIESVCRAIESSPI